MYFSVCVYFGDLLYLHGWRYAHVGPQPQDFPGGRNLHRKNAAWIGADAHKQRKRDMARPRKDGTAPAPPNKVLLTPQFVSSVQPGERRMRFWDTGQEGLVLEVQPSGAKTYKLYYRRNNRPRWFTIGRANRIDLKVARKEARMHLARMELDDRLDIQSTRRERRKMETFAEVMDQYLSREIWRHRKRPDQIEYRLRKYILPRWQHHRLDTIGGSQMLPGHGLKV